MGIKILLVGAFLAVANVSSTFACGGCGCSADASEDHQHTDKGYVQAFFAADFLVYLMLLTLGLR